MKYALILIFCISLPAFAGEGGLIEKRDVDKDGRLSVDEFGRDREVFRLLDKNGDGFLTADEVPAGPAPERKRGKRGKRGEDARGEAPARFLNAHDADGDGQVSAAEWPKEGRAKFEKVDRNGDGFVDKTELSGLFARAQKGKGKEKGKGGKERRPPDPAQVQKMAQGMMKRLDKNGDGQLMGEELQGKGRLDLTKADKNQDGVVDLLEMTHVIQARYQQRRRGDSAKQMIERIKRLDVNGDGAIDREEFKGRPEMFKRLDANHDGKIGEQEIKRAAKAAGRWSNGPSDAAFRRFDTDGDGKISADEWKAPQELFQRFDADKDGFVTRSEITPRGPKGGRRAKMLDLKSGKDSAHFLQKYDQNRDGQVAKSEFPHERRFAEIDADGNGMLSETEIQDAMDKIQREKEYDVVDRYDLNGDGKVTRDEFTGAAANFERLDKNRDGVIDKGDG